MKILWLVEPMGGREGGEVKVARLSHTGGDLWNTNQPANTFAHAGAKLPWDGEALRVSTFVSALDAVTLWALGASTEGEIRTRTRVCVWRLVYSPLFANIGGNKFRHIDESCGFLLVWLRFLIRMER